MKFTLIKNKLFILSIILFSPSTITLLGQPIINVPIDGFNNRFYEDIMTSKRPALSINGFSNETNGYGYGLKQILEELYSTDSDIHLKSIYSRLVGIANTDMENPFNNPNGTPLDIAGRNSNRLQSLAFVALARYVLEHNGIDSVDSKTLA